METRFTASSNSHPTNPTLTFANCFSITTTSTTTSTSEEENVFVAPKRFPVYCGSCWLPIRDLGSLKKHRTIKRHYCREYPTSYQKQGFVKKDYRKCWRRERTKFNGRVPPTPSSFASCFPSERFDGSNCDAPTNSAGGAAANLTNGFVFSAAAPPAASSFPKLVKIAAKPASTTATAAAASSKPRTRSNIRPAAASTATAEEANDVFYLEDLFSLPDELFDGGKPRLANGHRRSTLAAEPRPSTANPLGGNKNLPSGQSGAGTLNGVVALPTPATEEEGTMDATPSASPFQPFQAITGAMGGYFTYSKQNCFVKEPQKVGGVDPSPSLPKTTTTTATATTMETSTSFQSGMHRSLSKSQFAATEKPKRVSDAPHFTPSTAASSSSTAASRHPSEDARSFLNRLKDFRDVRFLTDIFLIVDEKKVYAHKVVLSAQSPFFRDLIGKCVDTPSYGLRLDFGFSHDAFLIALDFIYGSLPGEKIHSLNAAEVKAVAQKLQLEGLEKYSEAVLQETPEFTAAMESKFESTTPPPQVTRATQTSPCSSPSPFNVESSLAELSNICAEFTATALDADQCDHLNPPPPPPPPPQQLVDFDAMEEDEANHPRRRKPDPPLSSVDVVSGGGLFDGSIIGEGPSVGHRRSDRVRRDSQSSTMMTPNPHLDVDAEILGGSFKNDFLPTVGFGSLDDNPFDELFNFGDGTTNSSLFGSPIFGALHNNNNSHGSTPLDSLGGAQQKIVFSPPVVVHPPKTAPFPPPTKRETAKELPSNLQSSPLKRPLSGNYQPSAQPPLLPPPPPPSMKEFSAMLSTQYAAKDPQTIASKSCMNCIICDDVIEGQTKIEQWIKLCQHLADKHKKVIDREILTKQFGIQESAISRSVLEGERGAASPGFVLKASYHGGKVGGGERAAAAACNTTGTTSQGAPTSANVALADEKRGDAKARLNRFLCQKRILNAELMVHVKKVPSSSHEGKDERYSCLRCAKEFDSLTPIQRHLVVNHGVPLPGLQILMCSHCGNKDVDREENMSETGPSKSCNVCKHRMSRMQD